MNVLCHHQEYAMEQHTKSRSELRRKGKLTRRVLLAWGARDRESVEGESQILLVGEGRG